MERPLPPTNGRKSPLGNTDDRLAFEEKKRAQAEALGRDPQVFEASLAALQAANKYDYPYLWSWLGVPIIQLPADVMATQEIIWATKPDVIVETGVARGGSVLFMASLRRGRCRGRSRLRECRSEPNSRLGK